MREIEDRLKQFVLCRLWTNDRHKEARSAEWRALLEKRFGTSAIPLYVILTPEDEEVGKLAFPGGTAAGFVRPMAEFLDRGLATVKK